MERSVARDILVPCGSKGVISALATIELCYNASRNRSCDLMTSLKVSGKSKYFSECNSVTCLNIVISDFIK